MNCTSLKKGKPRKLLLQSHPLLYQISWGTRRWGRVLFHACCINKTVQALQQNIIVTRFSDFISPSKVWSKTSTYIVTVHGTQCMRPQFPQQKVVSFVSVFFSKSPVLIHFLSVFVFWPVLCKMLLSSALSCSYLC